MKDKIKGFISGILVCLLAFATVAGAANGSVLKELWYKNIRITLNGGEITPTDANGNYVEPFIIDGTTYLPVRAISNALGMGVEWDGETSTVKLSTSDGEKPVIVESVVYNSGGIRISYAGMSIDESNDLMFLKAGFIVENNTQSTVCVQARNESVNGQAADGIMSGVIAAHSKDNAYLYFRKNDMANRGVYKLSDVKKIELSFHIFEQSTSNTMADSDSIEINPYGLATDGAGIVVNSTPEIRTSFYDTFIAAVKVNNEMIECYNNYVATNDDSSIILIYEKLEQAKTLLGTCEKLCNSYIDLKPMSADIAGALKVYNEISDGRYLVSQYGGILGGLSSYFNSILSFTNTWR